MIRRAILLGLCASAAVLGGLTGCENTSGSVSMGVGYYGGYYPGYYDSYYPGYWYDDDRPINIERPENGPGRPTTLPADISQRPSTKPAARPTTTSRPSSMSRPAPRATPRARGR